MKYDFRLFLNEIDTNGIFIYNQEVVKTPNEAINCTVNEKIRRYNNSVVYLMNYLEILIQKDVYGNIIVDYCKDVFSDADNEFRMIVRNICLEMFVLREKIHNILCSIFFVKQKKNFVKEVVPMLKNVATQIPKLGLVLDYLKEIGESDEASFITKIRNDEIHNMSIIDSFNLALENNTNGVKVINNGYRIGSKELYHKIITVADKYLKLVEMIQDILNDSIIKIYKVRETMDLTIIVNKNELF